jgi:hypothetical protein
MSEQENVANIHLNIPAKETSISQFITPRNKPQLYPGTRPDWSFCYLGSNIAPIRVKDAHFEIMVDSNNWKSLEGFIVETTGVPLTERFAVLAVGSNACPARLADVDKYGDIEKVAIPVLYGWIDDVVSVYSPWFAEYKSIPSTIMGVPGSKTKLWVTLLTERELHQMDKSESRGTYYELVELPNNEFIVENRIRISPITAYYDHTSIGLKDTRLNLPIMLSCFDVIGANFPRMSQKDVQNYIITEIGVDLSLMEINEQLKKDYSIPISLPPGTKTLEIDSLPSDYARYNE